jgi:hypothetical protein
MGNIRTDGSVAVDQRDENGVGNVTGRHWRRLVAVLSTGKPSIVPCKRCVAATLPGP